MPLSFIVGFAAVFGTAEAIRHTQAKSRRQEHRSRKNNLTIHCIKSTRFSPQLEGKLIVLSGDKLFVDTGEEWDQPFGYPFAGYYMPYPEAPYAGLVSQIMDDPPMMNWIYVDKDTYEVKFGTRAWAEPNYNGPFDCTRQDRRLTFGGWEGFCLVKNGNFWSLYFDLDDDKLKAKLPKGTVVLEIELTRKEMRVLRPKVPEKEEGEEGEGGDGKGEEGAAAAAPDWKMAAPKAFAPPEKDEIEGEGKEGEKTEDGSGKTEEQTQENTSPAGEGKVEAESGYQSPSVEEAPEGVSYKRPSVEDLESEAVD